MQSLCQHVRQKGPKAGPWEILAVSLKEKLFPALSRASLLSLSPLPPSPQDQDGSQFLTPLSPNPISTAITYRMVCGMEFYTFFPATALYLLVKLGKSGDLPGASVSPPVKWA